MKLLGKILAGILVFLILLIAGLNLYFTDERLKGMILPQISEALDRDVRADRMSVTLFRTFPRFGLRIEGFMLPDDQGEPVAAFESLIGAVRLFPLMQNEISLARLDVNGPAVYYRVYADSTTNIDFLLTEQEDETDEAGPEYAIRIPRFVISGADIYYIDETTGTRLDLEGLDAEIGLDFAGLIESTVDASLQSLSAWQEETEYVSGLALRLRQRSTIDLEEELLTLSEGTFSIRGFDLNLSGSVSDWSSDSPLLDLQFSSSTENFGELLSLAPPEYDEHLQGLETRGGLRLEGAVRGRLTEENIPDFNLDAAVSDGYLQNPDLQEPIENIDFALRADNSSVILSRFSATAAGNEIEASGNLDRPFDDDAPFTFRLDGSADLATFSQFYPLDQAGVETLSGLLTADIETSGSLDDPEGAVFDGSVQLSNGLLKYVDVPQSIEDIEADIEATRELVTIHAASFRALDNRFSMTGSVSDPMADLPEFDVLADLDFDLGTIGDFYPIDEDTLVLRGKMIAQAGLRGQADQIEQALQNGTIELRDGYIDHRLTAQPLEDVTFLATIEGPRLVIGEARFRTGENRLSMSGTVDDYLEDDPLFDLTIDGSAILADIASYYPLEPWINELTGGAQMDLNARGPAGEPTRIALNGTLELTDVVARGDSLNLPVTNLNGVLAVRPDAITLESFFMNFGSSDISLEGRLENYLGFMQEYDSEAAMPSVSGTYHSRLLDMDEMMDWDEETGEEPLPVELPRMTGTVDTRIDSLTLFGIYITEIEGRGRTNPDQLVIEDASASMFDGSASGSFTWNVPRPDRTNLRFSGSLEDLQVEAFFREFPILGENSRFERHLTGGFDAEADYYTELDEFITPDISTTTAEGSFGMSRARMQGHPFQENLAEWLGADELRSLALDEWTATFSIRESVLTLNDFRLTSENIGLELDGTQHLETDEIDFTAQLFLPSGFRSGLSSVLSSRVVDALTNDEGLIVVPLRISGTMENPRFTPQESIIEDLLRDTGRDILRGLFN